jgi:hypothetical protein
MIWALFILEDVYFVSRAGLEIFKQPYAQTVQSHIIGFVLLIVLYVRLMATQTKK